MDPKTFNHLRHALARKREELTAQLQQNDGYGLSTSLKDSVHELSAYDNHPADLGTETFEREKDLALLEHTRRALERIDDALGRMSRGDYGRCEHCNREIGEERLNALPETTRCLECEQRQETDQDHRARPVEEELLHPPFGRTFLDGTDNVVTDGEDIWQEVARYGTSETPSDLGGEFSYDNPQIDGGERVGTVTDVEQIAAEDVLNIDSPDAKSKHRRRKEQ